MTTGGFLLRRLQVFNWGSFHGLDEATIDPHGTAVIGPTGSGKTTLVDGLMTLLAAQPRYNLASTGGHESDRDLMSYVRGVSGPGAGVEGDGSHVARPGRTSSALAATLVQAGDGIEPSVTLAALFWTEGPGSAAADRDDYWLVLQGTAPPQLSDWLSMLHEEGIRAVKRAARSLPDVQGFETKKAYLAQVRRFFGVGENAFSLLNRAAGLKQLNSIDDIFRELVLDDRSHHQQAEAVVREFDNLVDIHQELQRAIEQEQALQPVARLASEHETKAAQLALQRRLLDALPGWFALAGTRLWEREAATLAAELADAEADRERNAGEQAEAADAERVLRQGYLDAGGGNLADKEALLLVLRQRWTDAQVAAVDYARIAARLGLPPALDEASLAASQATAADLHAKHSVIEKDLQQAAYLAGGKLHEAGARANAIEADLRRVRERPGSNLPPAFQDFRAELATALHLKAKELPYLAELVEVQAQEQRWRGAIERALGGERLRLLVPAGRMQEALRWVNARDNRLHVRLLDAQLPLRQRREPFADGFVRKLKLAEHPLRASAGAFLAQHDRHCVASPDALQGLEHGMTAEGLMSGQEGRYDKQDQRPLQSGWLTGFDNRDQLRDLQAQFEQAQEAKAQAQRDLDQASARHARQRETLDLLARVAEVRFEQIDVQGTERAMERLAAEIRQLREPGSYLVALEARLRDAAQALEGLRSRGSELDRSIGGAQTRLRDAQQHLQRAQAALPIEPDQLFSGLDALLPALDAVPVRELESRFQAEQTQQQREATDLQGAEAVVAQQLVRAMNGAKRVDTGELAEAGTELQDVPAYLERLRTLREEALPDKRERFQLYLNQSSDQGVSQLLGDLENEVSAIEERIEELNATLARVAFQRGRHLQLVTRKVVHQALRDLDAARRVLRSAALRIEDPEGHFRALSEVVRQLRQAADNRRTLAARALLDPRWRLAFAVSLIESDSGRVVETRTGSQGGSGGEKEIIASYILTASLSYALAPQGQAQPRFATVVLDEAFSRTSQAVAARIIAALRAFGLHPLFVTPNKEMRLLREHTRSAILVLRKGMQSQLASIRWEQLDEHAATALQARNGAPNEREP